MKNNMKTMFKLILFLLICCCACYFIWNKYKDVTKESVTCEFIKTYRVLNVAESNDSNYIYVTLRAFQNEEVTTVKLPTTEYPYIENEYYEFKFRMKDKKIDENIDSIFTNAEFVDAVITSKEGINQIQNPVCK